MANPLEPDESALESVLRFLGRPGYGVRNLLSGNVEGAFRQGADIVGDIFDWATPGDWIPEFSRRGKDGEPNDYTEGSDLLRNLGVADIKPGLGKLAADIGVGLLTDPLTFTGVGAVGTLGKAGATAAKAGGAALKTAKATPKALTVGVPFSNKLRVAVPGTENMLAGIGSRVAKASNAADTVPGMANLKKGMKELGHGVRSTFAALKPTQEIAEHAAEAKAAGRNVGQAASMAGAETLGKYAPDIQDKAFYLLQDVIREGDQFKRLNVGTGLSGFGNKAEQVAAIDRRLAATPWDDATKEAVRGAAIDASDFFRTQYGQAVKGSVLQAPTMLADDAGRFFPEEHVRGLYDEDVKLLDRNRQIAKRHLAKAGPDADSVQLADFEPAQFDDWLTRKGYARKVIPEDVAPLDYVPRMWESDDAMKAFGGENAALPGVIKSRTITDPNELIDMLNSGRKVETNLGKIAGQYGQSMGRAYQAAQVGKKTLGDKFVALSDAKSRSAMGEAIDGLRQAGDLDSAKTLEVAFKGLKPRKPIMTALANVNRRFKQAATAGFIVPRINFTVRNVVGSTAQALSNSEARGVTGQAIKRLPGDILGSIADGLRDIGVTAIPESRYASIAKAARQSDGTRADMLARIADPRMRSAVEHGVLDSGFIDVEKLADKLNRDPGFKNLLDWTSTIAQSAEQRMRFGMFDDLLTANPKMSPKEAARIVTETLFDYDYASEANRLFRDIVPFGQFTAKAVPQAAKFLAEQPAAAAAIRPLYTQDTPDNPLPGYLQRQPVVPLGDDERGDPQYLTGLGLPFEVLGSLPNPSDDLMDMLAQTRQGVLGQATPPLKSLGAALFGVDPMFGTPFGSYDKAPEVLQALGADEHGKAGRIYNMLASTGLIQPLASPVGYISGMMDDRKSAGDAALGALTGAQVRSVDEDKALQQAIEEAIRRNPEIKRFISYYQTQPDADATELIDALNAAKARIKAKKVAAQ